MKRAFVITINTLLALLIVGIIVATWMPAIYTSQWFQQNHWVRVHLLRNS
jgi:hypothetical protein